MNQTNKFIIYFIKTKSLIDERIKIMKKINISDYPQLFNLLSLNNVIAADTFIEDSDSGEQINLNDLICDAVNDFEKLVEDLQK